MTKIAVIRREAYPHLSLLRGEVFIPEPHIVDKIEPLIEWRERNEELENDPDFKQVIPYVAVHGPEGLYVTRRLEDSDESRLHGRLSVGLGGHIDETDRVEESNKGVILAAAFRELEEEIGLRPEHTDFNPFPPGIADGSGGPRLLLLGFVNYDSDAVGLAHIGIVFLATISVDAVDDIYVRETEKLEGWWEGDRGLGDIHDHEKWSQMLLLHAPGVRRSLPLQNYNCQCDVRPWCTGGDATNEDAEVFKHELTTIAGSCREAAFIAAESAANRWAYAGLPVHTVKGYVRVQGRAFHVTSKWNPDAMKWVRMTFYEHHLPSAGDADSELVLSARYNVDRPEAGVPPSDFLSISTPKVTRLGARFTPSEGDYDGERQALGWLKNRILPETLGDITVTKQHVSTAYELLPSGDKPIIRLFYRGFEDSHNGKHFVPAAAEAWLPPVSHEIWTGATEDILSK
jgi:predicted NUDIX family phosphoesterase